MASKIALNIICRDEEKTIGRTISSIIPEVDAIYVLDTGSTDKTVEICKSLGANVIEVGEKFVHTTTKEDEKWIKDYLGPYTLLKEGDKLFRFAQARNYLLSQVPREYDWILWVDADDIFRGKENIRQIAQAAEDSQATMVFLNYIYHADFNPDGSIKSVLIEHLRERFFRNDGTYKWVGEIHETLMSQRNDKKIDVKEADVIHLTGESDITASINRNIKNLEYEIMLTKAEDPRPLYYLAKAYFDLDNEKHNKEAERLIKAYHKGSGWPEERGRANIEQKKTTLVGNPRDLVAKSLEVIYKAALQTNKLDEAWAAAHKMVEMFPEHELVKKEWNFVNSMRTDKDLTVKAMEIARFLYSTNQKEKIKMLIASLPESVASNQLITQMSHNIFPSKTWDGNEIAMYIGPGFEVWSPKTIEKKGSGGSEEAVYRLSKEFVGLGYKVTVFADPGIDRGMHDGVMYKHFYEINWKDNFNVLVSWRNPGIMDMKINAKHHYLWLHDIPMVREFTPKRLENVDKVMVLSEYQGSLLKPFTTEGKRFGVQPEKLMISRNGVSV